MILKPFLRYLGVEAYEPFLTKSEITIIEETSKALNEQETNESLSLQFLKLLLNAINLDVVTGKNNTLTKGMQSLIGYLCLITNQYDIITELYDIGLISLLPWKLLLYYYNYGPRKPPSEELQLVLNTSDLFLEDDVLYLKTTYNNVLSESKFFDLMDSKIQDFFWNKMFTSENPLPSLFLAIFSLLFGMLLRSGQSSEQLNMSGNLLFSAIIRCQELENYYALGRFLQVLGLYHINMGQFQDALEAQQESYNLLLDAGDDRSAMAVFANLASTYFTVSDFENAIIVEKIAVEYYRQKKVKGNSFFTLVSLITFLTITGEYEEAMNYLNLLNLEDGRFTSYTLNELLGFLYSVCYLRHEEIEQALIKKFTIGFNNLKNTEQQSKYKLAQMLLIIFHELSHGNLGNAEEVLNQVLLMKPQLSIVLTDIIIYKIQFLILLKKLLVDSSPKILEQLSELVTLMLEEIKSYPNSAFLVPPLHVVKEAIKALESKSDIPPLLLGNYTKTTPLNILEHGNEFISKFNEIDFYNESTDSLAFIRKIKFLELYFIREIFVKSIFISDPILEIKNSLLSILVLGVGGVTIYQHVIDQEPMNNPEKSETDGISNFSHSVPHDLLANFYNVISLKYSQILQQEEYRFQKIFKLQDYSILFRPCNEKQFFVVGIMRKLGIKELNTIKFITTKIDNSPDIPSSLYYSNKEISEHLRKIIIECLALTNS